LLRKVVGASLFILDQAPDFSIEIDSGPAIGAWLLLSGEMLSTAFSPIFGFDQSSGVFFLPPPALL